jgi:hypothetical protein
MIISAPNTLVIHCRSVGNLYVILMLQAHEEHLIRWDNDGTIKYDPLLMHTTNLT